MRVLSQTLSAGQTWSMSIQGDYFRLHNALYPVDVTFFDNQPVDQISGMLAGLWTRITGGYRRIDIVSATAQTVTIIVGHGEAGADRIMGEVSVISGEKARVIAGTAYCASAWITATVGQYAHVQLWNPAASAQRVIITKVRMSSQYAGYVSLRSHSAALGSLYDNPKNKLVGAGAALQEMRIAANASIQGSLMQLAIRTVNTLTPIDLDEPIIVAPGYGLHIADGTVNQDLAAIFEYHVDTI